MLESTRQLTAEETKAICLSIAGGIRSAADSLTGKVPEIGILKMRLSADEWERAAHNTPGKSRHTTGQ